MGAHGECLDGSTDGDVFTIHAAVPIALVFTVQVIAGLAYRSFIAASGLGYWRSQLGGNADVCRVIDLATANLGWSGNVTGDDRVAGVLAGDDLADVDLTTSRGRRHSTVARPCPCGSGAWISLRVVFTSAATSVLERISVTITAITTRTTAQRHWAARSAPLLLAMLVGCMRLPPVRFLSRLPVQRQ